MQKTQFLQKLLEAIINYELDFFQIFYRKSKCFFEKGSVANNKLIITYCCLNRRLNI